MQPGPAPAALADRRAIGQVLLNLLDNAIKYSEPGGRIEIALTGSRDAVRIDVSDTGIGIPEADRARIFERFYRVEKARSRDLGGTGLGLSIVKHLLQALDGEVFVASREGKERPSRCGCRGVSPESWSDSRTSSRIRHRVDAARQLPSYLLGNRLHKP